MNEEPIKKRRGRILGAVILGVALVGGAWVTSNFGKYDENDVSFNSQNTLVVAPKREYIQTYDKNDDGISDWEEELVESSQTVSGVNIDLSTDTEGVYVRPDTTTGEFSISFIEDAIRAKGYGPFGATQEKLISNSINSLVETSAVDTLYGTGDILVSNDESDYAIRTYGNEMANIITRNNIDAEIDVVILQNALRANDPSILEELAPIATAYKNMRDEMLRTPVPVSFVKEHLDLINVYNAIFISTKTMQDAFVDPLPALLRIKRYEDDATGLFYALQNMYLALDGVETEFTTDDPAVLFILFAPE